MSTRRGFIATAAAGAAAMLAPRPRPLTFDESMAIWWKKAVAAQQARIEVMGLPEEYSDIDAQTWDLIEEMIRQVQCSTGIPGRHVFWPSAEGNPLYIGEVPPG